MCNIEIKLLKEGSESCDRMDGATALSDGSVVLTGGFEGTWGGVASQVSDFPAVKLDSAGIVKWRWKVNAVTTIMNICIFQSYRSALYVYKTRYRFG